MVFGLRQFFNVMINKSLIFRQKIDILYDSNQQKMNHEYVPLHRDNEKLKFQWIPFIDSGRKKWFLWTAGAKFLFQRSFKILFYV